MTGRFREALRAIVRELLAPTAFHALVRYRVVKVAGDRLNLQVVRPGLGFPNVVAITQHGGIPGGSGDPKLGSTVLVAFVEGDPAIPRVVAYDGQTPTRARLRASELVELGDGTEIPVDPTGRLVRYGDTIAWLSPGTGPIAPAPATPIAKVSA